MKIMFPGVSCCTCGHDLPPGSEAVVHPTMRGPKGGKKYAHVNCGVRKNPRKAKKNPARRNRR
jgi:hypothetical protein